MGFFVKCKDNELCNVEKENAKDKIRPVVSKTTFEQDPSRAISLVSGRCLVWGRAACRLL